jgi:hypothetical protein
MIVYFNHRRLREAKDEDDAFEAMFEMEELLDVLDLRSALPVMGVHDRRAGRARVDGQDRAGHVRRFLLCVDHDRESGDARAKTCGPVKNAL